MKRRILSALTALAMALTLVPSAALAAESGPGPDSMGVVEERLVREEQTVVPDAEDLPDNDELFAGYVEQVLYGDLLGGFEMFGIGNPAGARLTGMNKEIYDRLKTWVAQVAAGKVGASTDANGSFVSFSMTAKDLPEASRPTKTSWTADEVKALDSTIEDPFGTEEDRGKALDAIYKAIFNAEAIVHALLADCPYEMYWFDKTTGYIPGLPIYTTETAYEFLLEANSADTTITFKFYLSTNYTEQTTAAQRADAAAKTAQQVVSSVPSGASAYDRLLAYKNYICKEVTYDFDALNTGEDHPGKDYGDPWQMISVFDNDSTTNVVCEGYSKAFQYLCDLSGTSAGFECHTVTGNMSGGTGAGDHMWNIVTMGTGNDAKNYLVDVTNCDLGKITVEKQDKTTEEVDAGTALPEGTERLFLVGGTKNEATYTITPKPASFVHGDSTITVGTNPITYIYDADTIALYPDTTLTLDTANYPIPTPKITPVLTTPVEDLTATYGQTLNDVSLADVKAQVSNDNPTEVDGTWAWVDSTTSVGDVKDSPKQFAAKFTPTNSDTYNSFTAQIPVTVDPKQITIEVSGYETSYVYTNGAIVPNLTVTGDSKTLIEDTDYTVAGLTDNINVGTVNFSVGPVSGGNYSFAQQNFSFTITPKPRTLTITPPANRVYTGSAVTAGISSASADITYTYDEGGTPTVKWYSSDGTTVLSDPPKDAGTYQIGVSVTADGNYAAINETKESFTIQPADYTYSYGKTTDTATNGDSYPTATNANGTGVSGESVSGMLTWYKDAARSQATTETDKFVYNADDQTVILYWQFTPDGTNTNYKNTPVTGAVTYTVSNLPKQTMSFAESAVTKTYGESAFTNALTHSVAEGGTKGSVAYTSSAPEIAVVDSTSGEVSIKKVGNVTITATAAGTTTHAETSVSYTLTVSPKTLTDVAIGEIEAQTYTGSDIEPTVTVTSNLLVTGDTLTAGTDYDVEYSNNVNAGTAKVTVTAKEGSNYTWAASVTANFTINKKAGPEAPSVTGNYAVSTTDPEKFVYTINPIDGAEYSKDGSTYGDSNVFDGITPETTVTFYARIKGTDNVEAGAAGSKAVTFNKLNYKTAPTLDYAVSGTHGNRTITITSVAGAEYCFDYTAGTPEWGTTNEKSGIAGESVTIAIRFPDTATMNGTTPVTKVVDLTKTSQAAPSAFELVLTLNEDGATYTATIPAVAGAEYSFDGGTTWSDTADANKKTDVAPGASVTGSIRMKATDEYLASPVVSDTKTAPLLKVATPTANPVSGTTFTDTLTVRLSCATEGASIYYTTDGSEPSKPETTAARAASSTPYNDSTAIQLTESATIKAIAVKEGMMVSDVMSATYTKETVVVPTPIPVTGVSLDQSALHLTVGGTAQLIATVLPSNADNRNVTWSSSDATVAAVSGGAVSALRAGSAVITVTTADGGYAASCTITVTTPNVPVGPSGPSGGGSTGPVTPVVPNPGTPSTPSNPSTPGGSNNNNNNNSSNNNNNSSDNNTSTPGGGNNAPDTPSNPSVAPEATVSGGTASATVSGEQASQLVDQAGSGASTVVIAPDVTGDVSRTEVSIPAAAVSGIAGGSSADLKVETPAANITISNSGLASLGSQGGDVVVSAETVGNAVSVEITAGGQRVDTISGGVKAEIPAECGPGTVAQVVDENGNVLSTVRKSFASDGGQTMNVPLEGSAKVVFVDNSKSFADVPATNWAANAVAFASGHELMNGVSATSFSPAEPMTRGMLAVVLHNLEGNPSASYSGGFGDVSSSAWYAEAVQWASENKIVAGVSEGSFAPDASITREQLVVMLYRYAGEPKAGSSLAGFSDSAKVSTWAQQAMAWAVSSGIVGGSNGALNPQSGATRAEVAQMLMNFVTNGGI